MPQSPSGEILGVKFNNGRVMKFTEIYAALVRETMRQARWHPASREALTADLSRKILSALVSRRNFERSNFKRRNSKGKFRSLNFKSGLAATEAARRCELVKFKDEFLGAREWFKFLNFAGARFKNLNVIIYYNI
nr:hypothetical protein [uncultured Campylobacter sp.]